MSQYPSPYSPPQYQMSYAGYDPAQPLLSPARNAGIMMIVLGVLGILLGLCMLTLGALLPGIRDQLSPQQLEPLAQLESQTGFAASALMYFAGGIFVVPGLIFLIMGPFVRKGGAAWVTAALVLTILILLFMVVSFISSLLKGSPADACFGGVALVLLGLQLWWLIFALKNRTQIEQLRYAYQMQMWQYQQQAQAYGAGQYPQPPAGFSPANYPPSAPPPTQAPTIQAPTTQAPPTQAPPTQLPPNPPPPSGSST